MDTENKATYVSQSAGFVQTGRKQLRLNQLRTLRDKGHLISQHAKAELAALEAEASGDK